MEDSPSSARKRTLSVVAGALVLVNIVVDYWVLFPLGAYEQLQHGEGSSADVTLAIVAVGDTIKLFGASVIVMMAARGARIGWSILQAAAALITMVWGVILLPIGVLMALACESSAGAGGGCDGETMMTVLFGHLASVVLSGAVLGMAIALAVLSGRRVRVG